ncbi:MAG: Cd(II)/Pb(II)-responsive transcriptional regulator [Nevskiaceae bacterium]|nr:MAG: Cd(II)/Pb(II)-responsive transcriptional regulator [Nevskiaceae bacterium]
MTAAAVNLKIGDLARRAYCPAETIRYYEREGLLPEPARTNGNYRLYGAEHVERLSFIRNCRSLDMTLDEIRKLLLLRDAPDDNCEEVNVLLDGHIGHVAERIAELRHLRTDLQLLRERCGKAGTTKDCGILGGLSANVARKLKTPRRGHVPGTHRR